MKTKTNVTAPKRRKTCGTLLLVPTILAFAASSAGQHSNLTGMTEQIAESTKADVTESTSHWLGKPTPPIEFSVQVPDNLRVGETSRLRVSAATSLQDMPLRVSIDTSFAAGKYHEIEIANMRLAMWSIDATHPIDFEFDFTPTREGRYLIRVYAEFSAPDRTVYRTQLFPVQVGSRRFTPRVNGTLMQDSDGELVVSMRPRQTIQ